MRRGRPPSGHGPVRRDLVLGRRVRVTDDPATAHRECTLCGDADRSRAPSGPLPRRSRGPRPRRPLPMRRPDHRDHRTDRPDDHRRPVPRRTPSAGRHPASPPPDAGPPGPATTLLVEATVAADDDRCSIVEATEYPEAIGPALGAGPIEVQAPHPVPPARRPGRPATRQTGPSGHRARRLSRPAPSDTGDQRPPAHEGSPVHGRGGRRGEDAVQHRRGRPAVDGDTEAWATLPAPGGRDRPLRHVAAGDRRCRSSRAVDRRSPALRRPRRRWPGSGQP